VAKAVNNGKAQSGKGAPSGKPGATARAVSKRPESKPARGKTQAAAARTRASSTKASEGRSIGKFLHEVRVELRKVIWPTRKELVQSVVVVLVAVGIATLYTLVLDTAFSRVIDAVVGALTSS